MARILIVDDSPTVIAVTRTLLMMDGHQVETLTSFVELPKLLRYEPPDLIILDLNMPTMNGETFGQFIRKHEKRATRVLIYSAATPERLAQASRELGAPSLAKNQAGKLRGVVSSLLAGAEPRSQAHAGVG